MNTMLTTQPLFRPRSFVCRNGRKTMAQKRALMQTLPLISLDPNQPLNIEHCFTRKAPLYLEIGFGTGQSLLAAAKQFEDFNFIGIETHEPGIGAVCLGVETENLTNLFLYQGDAVEIVKHCFEAESFDGVQLFFPDPWPKRRHHCRRILQLDFALLLISKLKSHGTLHLATDWEDYAKQMMRVLSAIPSIQNVAGVQCFANRSPLRPIITKFESRAIKEGRQIWDLQFVKTS